MRARVLMAAVAVLVLPACGGPRRPIDVAVKEFPGDVAIGKKTTLPPASEAPTAVNPTPVGFPSFLQPPAPIDLSEESTAVSTPPSTAKPPPAKACGVADPTATPKREALKNVSGPPVTDAHVFRNDGTFRTEDRAGRVRQGPYPERSTRNVGARSDPDGTFAYAVTETSAVASTQTIYRVDPASGLYLVQVTTTSSAGSDTFTADRPDALLLLPFPVQVGMEVGGVALDTRSATTMRLTGSVVGKTRVDACGTPLDAWEVQITEGFIIGPGKQVRFTANYAIGTQYGALSLRDKVEYGCDEQVNTYCDNGQRIAIRNTATIAGEPKAATR